MDVEVTRLQPSLRQHREPDASQTYEANEALCLLICHFRIRCITISPIKPTKLSYVNTQLSSKPSPPPLSTRTWPWRDVLPSVEFDIPIVQDLNILHYHRVRESPQRGVEVFHLRLWLRADAAVLGFLVLIRCCFFWSVMISLIANPQESHLPLGTSPYLRQVPSCQTSPPLKNHAHS